MKIKLQNFNYKPDMKQLLITDHNTSYVLPKASHPRLIKPLTSCHYAGITEEKGDAHHEYRISTVTTVLEEIKGRMGNQRMKKPFKILRTLKCKKLQCLVTVLLGDRTIKIKEVIPIKVNRVITFREKKGRMRLGRSRRWLARVCLLIWVVSTLRQFV